MFAVAECLFDDVQVVFLSQASHNSGRAAMSSQQRAACDCQAPWLPPASYSSATSTKRCVLHLVSGWNLDFVTFTDCVLHYPVKQSEPRPDKGKVLLVSPTTISDLLHWDSVLDPNVISSLSGSLVVVIIIEASYSEKCLGVKTL